MLRELEVRDLGIIEHVRIELPAGFVVVSGETGAGKSLLVQSLQLLAGARADLDQVRSGAPRLLVEGCFDAPDGGDLEALLEELGIPAADELTIRREVVAGGRSRAWINDTPVTVTALQQLAPALVSIHGQHEQRGLTDPATHLETLDVAGGLLPMRARLAEAFRELVAVREELERQRRAFANRRDRLDAIAFQLREIEEARLEGGEDEGLREERALLRHSERIAELVSTASEALGGETGTVSLARAARAVGELAGLGLNVQDLADQLDQARLIGEEAERGLASLADRVTADPGRLEQVEARLALIERLEHKFGGTLDAVLAHRDALAAERENLDGAEDHVAALEDEAARREAVYLERAVELSARRHEAAHEFAAAVVAVLGRLGMADARLELALGRRTGAGVTVHLDGEERIAGEDGVDAGELMISANPGEDLRPMAKIASGGELSRIHLAIRTVLRERERRGRGLTLLFDEVDAGIGGRVADELGRLLAELGTRDQVLVVTHLPQVAGRATSHFVVTKALARGRTVTAVNCVAGDARVDEMVRMLAGGADTPAARQHARELLGEA